MKKVIEKSGWLNSIAIILVICSLPPHDVFELTFRLIAVGLSSIAMCNDLNISGERK